MLNESKSHSELKMDVHRLLGKPAKVSTTMKVDSSCRDKGSSWY